MKRIVIEIIVFFASIMFIAGTLGLKTGEKLTIKELFSIENLIITLIVSIIGVIFHEIKKE